MSENIQDIRLVEFSIIGKLSDGKCRELLTNKRTKENIINLILASEGVIKISDEIIEGIDLSHVSSK